MLPEHQQRILGYFIEEAKDHLNTIEQGLLNLQDTLKDPEMISEVFRAAHSIKGGSAMLGLSSIQHTSHRLEDCFKVLKDCPIQVDQKLESLFLSVSDTLKALLDQLASPFGLTDEAAQQLMSQAEPVFTALNEHMHLLEAQSGAASADVVSATIVVTAAPVVEKPSIASRQQEQWQEFQNQVMQTLRQMLQVFKTATTYRNRQQLQEYCQQLGKLGHEYNLPGWENLCKATNRAIANQENTYVTLAKIVIKEFKQGQELVTSGRDAEIIISKQLEALLLPELEWHDTNQLEQKLVIETPIVQVPTPRTALPELQLDDDIAHPTSSDPSGPEVGVSELNTLADLFDGEMPDLYENWQKEEGKEQTTFQLDANLNGETEIDLADFLFAEVSTDTPNNTTTTPEELTLLFGDSFEENDLFSSLPLELSINGKENSEIIPSMELFPPDQELDLFTTPLITSNNQSQPEIIADNLFTNLEANNLAQEKTSSYQPDVAFDNLFAEPDDIAPDDLFDPISALVDTPVYPSPVDDFSAFWDEETVLPVAFVGEQDAAKDLEDSLFAASSSSDLLRIVDFADTSPSLDLFAIPTTNNIEPPELETPFVIPEPELELEIPHLESELETPFILLESELELETPHLESELEIPFTLPESESESELELELELETPHLESELEIPFTLPEPESDPNNIASVSDVLTPGFAGIVSVAAALFTYPPTSSATPSILSAITIADETEADDLAAFDEFHDQDDFDEEEEDATKSSVLKIEVVNLNVLEEIPNANILDATSGLKEIAEAEVAPQVVAVTVIDTTKVLAEEDFELFEALTTEENEDFAVFEALTTEETFDFDVLTPEESEDFEALTPEESEDFNALIPEESEYFDALIPEEAGDFDALESLTIEEAGDFDALESLTIEEAGDFDALEALTAEEAGDFAAPEALTAEEAGDFAAPEASTTEIEDDFAALEALITETKEDVAVLEPLTTEVAAEEGDFDALEALLNLTSIEDSFSRDVRPAKNKPIPVVLEVEDEFSDLEKLLEEADNTIGSSPAAKSSSSRSARLPSSRRQQFEQNMRVPVKHLDSLSNLVGELVVNRNTLEQDQERLRQFLDNLLHQVQNLSDVGARMQELYERSLLEASLLASRGGRAAKPDDSSLRMGLSDLELDRFTPFHTLSQEMIELIVRVRESASDIDFVTEETERVARQFRQVTTHLQEGLTRARMVSFAQATDRLQRGVRDNAINYGKQVELVIEGRDTLIDKMILEHLADPLVHMLNNAIAHGIETPQDRQANGKPATGKITVRAFHQGNQTIISVGDDGAGIDSEKVKAKAIKTGLITADEAKIMSRLDVYELLFHSGFSIRDQADELAGRGVGMDVVRTALSEIRGTINTDSTLGKGTTFTIRLPLTLSICKALCCLSDRARIAFPMDGVEDTLDISAKNIQVHADGQLFVSWRDTLLPFRPLKELLSYNRQLSRGNLYGGNREDDLISIVIVRSGTTLIALQVDQVLSEQEIVIKQFEGPAPKPLGVAGATVLGDGRIMPIADVLELIDIFQGRMSKPGTPPTIPEMQLPEKIDPTVLIVDDSITVRELLSLTFNKAGYRVEQARDGQEAWDKLRSGLPCDIIFCDIEMPRCDGLELLSRIQKDPTLNQLPIAMLTSRGADKHRQMAVQLGASGYFTKPYLEEGLLDAASRMLKGEKLVHSNAATP
jgi:chemotaxis protein histidine kinase CheA/ActR/RegA family two-component response regulator